MHFQFWRWASLPKLQVTNIKNKEVTANPYPQNLEKKLTFETLNPKLLTLNPLQQIQIKPKTLNPNTYSKVSDLNQKS